MEILFVNGYALCNRNLLVFFLSIIWNILLKECLKFCFEGDEE